MKRARVNRFGDPVEVVELVDVGEPKAGPGEVLVRVLASPINPADLLRAQGRYGYGASFPKLPFWAGVEGAGQVIAQGEGVASPAIGALVLLGRVDGAWSERVVAKAAGLAGLPASADPQQAAMLTVNPPTAELMLTDFVALEAGQWVIQNAANSAVGHHLIRLAARRGIKTANVVRRPELVGALTAIGADLVLTDGPDLAKRFAAASGGALAGLAIDAVGGDASARLAACLAEGGTLVNYGLLGGEDLRIPASLAVFNDLHLRGFWLPRALKARSPAEVGALYRSLLGLVVDGTLKAAVEATYPLDRVGEALAHAARPGRSGKILIEP